MRHELNLTAPLRAVEPALLAQRLPLLAAALQGCTVQRSRLSPAAAAAPSAVQVFAAQLGVQRSYVSLEVLPALNAAPRTSLQAQCAQWCSELGGALAFTPSEANNADHAAGAAVALGTLSAALSLPHPAQFIGRDVATALPKTPEAKNLRQLFNASQMALHQTPLLGSNANSLWFSNAVALDALGASYVQSGLSAWWDALPAWDAEQAKKLAQTLAASDAITLRWLGADYELQLECARKSVIKFWQKPAQLSAILQQLGE